jgi:hypothetical protein
MALTVTFLLLRTWAQQRAHMENGGPLSTQEWKDLTNASIRKLYRILTQAFGSDYFGSTTNLTTTANVDTVNVPGDFFKLVSLWWDDGSGSKKRIGRASESDLENQLVGQGWAFGGTDVKHALRAGAIRFVPTPTAAYAVKCNYVKAPTTLVNDGDTLDGYGGFEEFIPWETAASALAKEESDASFCIKMRDEILQDIKETAERDQSEPLVIQSVTDWWGE